MLSVDDDLFLQFEYTNEETGHFDYFKLYSNSFSLVETKKQLDLNRYPIFIEICDTEEFLSEGRGFSLTLEQSEELVKILSSMNEYLKSQ